MALRVCKGKFIYNKYNKINYEFFNKDDNNKFIILTEEDRIVGYLSQDKIIHKEWLDKNNVFTDGYRVLKQENLDYVPIIENNEVIGFCFDDKCFDDILNKIKELILIEKSSLLTRKYNKALIYGYNELSYYLEKLFKKIKMPYDLIFDQNDIKDDFADKQNLLLYVEGNLGLNVDNYAFWKVNHEWLFDCMKPIYDFYKELNSFDYCDDNIITNKIRNKEPFMMARIGNTELWIVKQFLQKESNIIDQYSDFWLDYLFTTSGFFSKSNTIKDVDKFAQKHIEAVKNCDFDLAYGNDELAEGLKMFIDEIKKIDGNYYDWEKLTNPFDNNWYKELKNKKVLIVSPYSKSINLQFRNLNKLFKEKYPGFELITYNCVETQLGNSKEFNSFFDALETMEKDIKQIEFDIAFICAGAYGYLLSSYIKNMGKSSIELCSYLPNWFGIKIKRYCTKVEVNRFWNKNWIFPVNKIKNSEKIEDNCYWE